MSLDQVPWLGGAALFRGHMGVLRDQREALLARISREVDRVARLRMWGRPMIVANHPEVVHEVLVEKAKSFQKDDLARFALHPLGGEGLFTSNGELWRKQRKLMAPFFHAEQLRRYAADMVACALRGSSSFRDGQVVSLAQETTRITMGIAGKTLFDADTFSEADELGAALTVMLKWTADNIPSGLTVMHILARRAVLAASDRVPAFAASKLAMVADRLESPLFFHGSSGRAVRSALERLERQVQQMIDARRASSDKDDLLARLLRARDDDGAPMSDRQVRDEILTLFIAGHETTAAALAWAIYALCKSKDVYAEVQREVDALPGDPTYDDLARLELTSRVFKEALRVYPPVPIIARQSSETVSVDGHPIPAGTVVLVAPYCLHRRPEIWPDPERFDPSRFLPEAEAARPRCAWLPFGAGPRTCIGATFALIEGPLVLAALLRRASFEPLVDEVPQVSITLRPRSGMPMRVRLRYGAS